MFPRFPAVGVGLAAALCLGVPRATRAASSPSTADGLQTFIDQHCASCHDDVEKKGGLDLTALKFDLGDAKTFATWVTVHDRVQSGDMPPKKKARPDGATRDAFVAGLASSLSATERTRDAAEGRATRRRFPPDDRSAA